MLKHYAERESVLIRTDILSAQIISFYQGLHKGKTTFATRGTAPYITQYVYKIAEPTSTPKYLIYITNIVNSNMFILLRHRKDDYHSFI